MIGVVSPAWVSCYQNCGDVSIEFTINCLDIPAPGLRTDSQSVTNFNSKCCVSCVDSPTFVVGFRKESSGIAVTKNRDVMFFDNSIENHNHTDFSPATSYGITNTRWVSIPLRTINATVLLI
ncbi:MAG: hypothetical protein ACP5U1_03775 [Desulfomonilaceae bacterium]